jgi:hypothetical protein
MAIAYFGANGHTVSVPLNDTQDYDLVVDMAGKLNRVQVKATSHVDKCGAYSLDLRTYNPGKRAVCKTVRDTDIELLFCLCGDGTMYLIPKEYVQNTATLSLRKGKSKHARSSTPDYSRYLVTL